VSRHKARRLAQGGKQPKWAAVQQLCKPDFGIQDDDPVPNMSGVGLRRWLPFGLIHRFVALRENFLPCLIIDNQGNWDNRLD
jgi:hypothetical protein